jgi:TonB-linked SusC/RagA family outer membrane protein
MFFSVLFSSATNSMSQKFNHKLKLSTIDETQLKKVDRIEVVSLQQQRGVKVSGTVTDQNGTPLPGATVIIKGTTKGTITNTDGNYSLSNIPEDAVLVFSFVGMRTQEIAIKNQTIINITMEEEAIGIEEVVAIGYGTQKKVNLTGAVGVAGSERLENRTITSVGQGLQGVIPGLNITFQSGDPNEAANFNIRGFESINGGEPLILVDGIPMNAEKVNPSDIKSVSVLKDASSAAIYGARAAFGVILVETKKGMTGKTNIHVSAQTTVQKAIFPSYQPIKGGGTARRVWNDAFKLTRGRNILPEPVIEAALAYQEMDNPTEDDAWMYYENVLYPLRNYYMKDIVLRDFAPQQQYDFNINGASDKTSYYVSLGVINKEGFFKYGNENYKRYNVLSKVDFQVYDWLSLEEKISFASVLNDIPHEYAANSYRNSITRHIYMPIEFPDLSYYKEPGDRGLYEHLIGMYLNNQNPLPVLKKGGRDTRTENDIWLTQGVTITPLKGLKIKGDFSYQYYWSDAEDVASKVDVLKGSTGFPLNDLSTIIYNGETANDWIESRFSKNTYYVFNAFAEYTMEGISDHYAKALVGFNQEYGKNHRVTTRSTQLLHPNIHSLSATTGVKTNSDSKNEIMLRGLFYRLNYSYKDRYLFEINGRYDGTSRFPKEDRFGFFPSFSLGWRLSEESFMNNTRNWLDNLKIRASYGQLGNQSVGSFYPYISSMSPGTSNFLFGSGGALTNTIWPGGLVSNTLTWETVISKNIGVDVMLFNKRVDVGFDYFIRDTKDMLMEKSYPGTLGAAAPSENAADLRNTGWELAVTWSDKIGKDWAYQINLSLSDYQTEITKYENPTGAFDDYYVGKKVGEIWGYKTVGLFQTEEELANAADQSRIGTKWRLGDVHFADLDDDKVITTGSRTLDDPGDLTRIGNSTPRYAFGINPGIKYKNFSLDIFLQGILKKDWYPSTSNMLRFFPFKTLQIEQWWIDDSWTPENPDAYFPLLQYNYSDSKNLVTQSRYLQNAAYIRLKNVTLSYFIPVKFVTHAQVYLNGTNLWDASGVYKTLDPEQPSDLKARYLFQRTFTLGLKVTL